MPGRIALASSGDFAAEMSRDDKVSTGILSHYDLVAIFIPPKYWRTHYVIEFTYVPAGMEANVRMSKKLRTTPFVSSLRTAPKEKFTCFFFGCFEYGKSFSFVL